VDSRKGRVVLNSVTNVEDGKTLARWRPAGAHLLFALVLTGITLLLSWQVVPEVWEGELLDTDNYMRLLRVERLVESGNWFDNSVSRSNAPFGETLHWTKPLDLLLLAGSAVFRPFLGMRQALFLTGMVIAPFLLVLICFATAWAVVPLAGTKYRYFAMIGVLAQLAVMAYALPGRPDHHPLLLLCFIVAIGGFLRVLRAPFRTALAAGTGLVLAAGVWTSPEFLAPVFFIFLAGGLAWVGQGGDHDRKNLWLAGGFVLGLGAALFLERPVQEIFEPELDRLSVVHLLVGFLAWGSWLVIRMTGKRETRSRKTRLLQAAALSLAAFGILAAAFPRFFLGPTANVDPRLMELWFGHVGDNQPMVGRLALLDLGRLLALIGPASFCLPYLVVRSIRETRSGAWPPWLFVTISFTGFLGLALYQIRFAAYVEVLIAVVTATILSHLLPRINRLPRPRARLPLRAATAGALITGFVFLGGGLMGLGGAAVGPAPSPSGAGAGRCRILDLIPTLTGSAGLGGEPHTILTHVDFGPEILYRTQNRVLATPYHRNAQGILGAYDILSSTDTTEARRLAQARGVDLILLCPSRTSLYSLPPGESADPPRLYDRLVAGDSIPWIRPIPLGPNQGKGFLLFRVD
jgi:hypothetical protein